MSRCKLLIVTCLAMMISAAALRAEDLKPSWQCLPDQTLLVVRVPQPKKLVDQMRATTKFGKTMLSTERWDKLMKLWQDAAADDWKEMTDVLGKSGLKPEDLVHYLEGEFGFALVGEKRPGATPLMAMVMWMDCGEELAGKFQELVKNAVEEDANKEHPAKRVDMELSGQPVMLISNPEMHIDLREFRKQMQQRQDQMQMDGQVAPRQMAEEPQPGNEMPAMPQFKMIQSDQTNFMMTRMGGRVLMAVTIPNNTDGYYKKIDAGATPDQINYDELSGLPQAQGIFARFIAAHKGGDADYQAHMLSTPGMAAALPDGLPMLEFYGDLRPLWQMLDDQQMAQAMPVLTMLGIDKLSTGAMKLTLDGGVMRAGLFLAAASPRTGLPALLDQQPLEPVPAAWVPAHVVQYQRLSFDLGRAYAMVRDMVVRQFGDPAKQKFDFIDISVQGMAQTDLATALSAMGSQIMSVTYEPRTAGKSLDQVKPGDIQRLALVWQLKDEAIWQRMVTALAGMGMQFAGDKLEQANEQGFSGWRLKAPTTDVSVMLGKGYLVLAMGYGVSDEILNVLGNPPQGGDALAGSELMKRARTLIDLQPNLTFTLSDADRQVQTLLPLVTGGILKELEANEDDPKAKQTADALRQLLPSDEELKGMFGVSVGQMRVTDQGLVGQSAVELPQ